MLSNHNIYKSITRTYKGLIETLGEIGGIKELIYLAAYLLYSYYHERISKEILVKDVFKVEADF